LASVFWIAYPKTHGGTPFPDEPTQLPRQFFYIVEDQRIVGRAWDLAAPVRHRQRRQKVSAAARSKIEIHVAC